MFTKSKLYRNALLTSSLNKGFSTLLSFPAAVLVFSAAAAGAGAIAGRSADNGQLWLLRLFFKKGQLILRRRKPLLEP